jgi:hypothetical protein
MGRDRTKGNIQVLNLTHFDNGFQIMVSEEGQERWTGWLIQLSKYGVNS